MNSNSLQKLFRGLIGFLELVDSVLEESGHVVFGSIVGVKVRFVLLYNDNEGAPEGFTLLFKKPIGPKALRQYLGLFVLSSEFTLFKRVYAKCIPAKDHPVIPYQRLAVYQLGGLAFKFLVTGVAAFVPAFFGLHLPVLLWVLYVCYSLWIAKDRDVKKGFGYLMLAWARWHKTRQKTT